jgi:hypothetical protein
MNSEVENVQTVYRTLSRVGGVVLEDLLPDFAGISDAHGRMFTSRRIPLEHRPISVVESHLPSRPRRSAALQTLRVGLERFLLAAVIGVSLMVVTKGLGLAILYGGLLVLLVGTYRYGLRTGDYLVGPRYAILGMLALTGLFVTSLIAALEVFIQRGW